MGYHGHSKDPSKRGARCKREKRRPGRTNSIRSDFRFQNVRVGEFYKKRVRELDSILKAGGRNEDFGPTRKG